MKKTVLIILTLLLSLTANARLIDRLQKEYEVIEKDIKEYNDNTILRVSEHDYLMLQNLLLLKKLEIFEEERRIKVRQLELEREEKELVKRQEMNRSRYEDYKKNLDLFQESKYRVSKFELKETEYFVEYFSNEIKTAQRDLEYNHEQQKRYTYDFPESFNIKLKERREIIEKAYNKLFDLGEKTLKIYEINKRSKREIEEIQDEIEVLRDNYKTSMEDIDYGIKERYTELLNAKDNLKISQKDIEVREARIEVLKEQVKKGYSSQNEVFEEIIDLIMSKIDSLEFQARIDILEMELEE